MTCILFPVKHGKNVGNDGMKKMLDMLGKKMLDTMGKYDSTKKTVMSRICTG